MVDDRLVEFEVPREIAADVTLGGAPAHRLVRFVQNVTQSRGIADRQRRNDRAFELSSHMIKVVDILRRIYPNAKAAPRRMNHEPPQLKQAKSLAHGPPVAAEFSPEINLTQAGAGRIAPANDPGLNLIRQVIRDRFRQSLSIAHIRPHAAPLARRTLRRLPRQTITKMSTIDT